MSSSSDHRNVVSNSELGMSFMYIYERTFESGCEYYHAARYGSPPQKMQDANETEDSNFKAALEESLKEEKLRQRQAQTGGTATCTHGEGRIAKRIYNLKVWPQ